MANYAADYTSRVRIHYSDTNLAAHHAILRFGTINSPSTLNGLWNSIYGPFANCLLATTTIDAVDYAPVGSSLFLPLPGAPLGPGGLVGGSDSSTMAAGFYVLFGGRSAGGSAGGPYIFNVAPAYNRACRIPYPLVSGQWLALQSQFQASGLTCIDRGAWIPHAYVIVGINDEVEQKARR